MLVRHRPKIVLEIHRDVSRADVLALLESCGYLVDNEPIDDTLGAFADPQSNASFIFQANPFLSERTTTDADCPAQRLLSSLCSRDGARCLRGGEFAWFMLTDCDCHVLI